MRTTLLFLGILFTQMLNAQTTKRALFIGNSYTYYNDLPSLTAQIANSLGDSLYWQMVAPGGYTLEDHTVLNQTIGALDDVEWDFVIFQEQSQLPALSQSIFDAQVAPNAQYLCEQARLVNPCVKPAFYATWGRKNGDVDNCANFPWVCTYEEQQDSLTSRYLQLAQQNDAWCVPVGEVWREVLDFTDGSLELYDADGSHPSIAGSYVAACSFYSALFDNSPVGAVVPGNLDTEAAETIQILAATTILDEDETWNFTPVVWADLEFEEGPFFTLVNLINSFPVDSVHIEMEGVDVTWEPGDNGAFTIGPGWNPYVVTAYSECGEYVGIDSVFIEPLNVELIEEPSFQAFLSPSSGILNIEVPESGVWQFDVYNVLGEKVGYRSKEQIDGLIEWNISELSSGVYFLVAVTNKGFLGKRFYKW